MAVWLRGGVAALLTIGSAASAQIPETVRTDSGALAGGAVAEGVRAFKGVPFAAPPVGNLRWRPPQPVEPWRGVRRADRFGASAIQADTGAFGPWTKEFIFGNATSEDCLFLNVWTAARTDRERRPVIVWIHGGAFTGGSGEVAVYDGAALAKKGVVVVTVNYRLGALGFLSHPELARESPQGTSGNYGLLDQIAALRWVKRNIAAFGGDPERVTIAGQSAGGASVHCLTASPLARGLFQRAIVESGGSNVGRGFAQPRGIAENDGVRFAREKGASTLAELRRLPADKLIGSAVRMGPIVDGWFLPFDVGVAVGRGAHSDVPILTGFNADEGSASPSYSRLSPEQKASDRERSLTSMVLWATERAKTSKSPAFLYYFARAIPWPQHPEYGAFHTGEVPYVFGTQAKLDRPWQPADRKLADTVMTYWANFAAGGDPNGRGVPAWPKFDPKRPKVQRLDAVITSIAPPGGEKGTALRRELMGLRYDRLVPGFLPEAKNELGYAAGNGFGRPNPWGAYTAYRLATNARGQRTWRIENYVPMGNFMQGSTMYLLEGDSKALLIDTAQETPGAEAGKNDLTSVVRHLLGRNDDGSERESPVDFVVANTHFHFDHTGENAQMSQRAVYYPDLDWPERAPTNYVPIREGGGATEHGAGKAVGGVELGGRWVAAVNLYGHSPGSMGYLDRANGFVVTGDALGSSVVWMHFGPVSQYVDSLRHLQTLLAPMVDPAVLPAHFYQIASGDRAKGPYAGRPLDRAYVDDQLAAAQGALDGTVVAEPYRIVGRSVVLSSVRSAGMTYGLARLSPDSGRIGAYHAIRLPGDANVGERPLPIDRIRSAFHLIRDRAGNSLYLIRGSKRALLVGTGAGDPGLAAYVGKLVGATPWDVLITHDAPGQVGGLRQVSGRTVYVPRGSSLKGTSIGQGDVIDLGVDRRGEPVRLRVEAFAGRGLTLVSEGDRALLAGDALGRQGDDGGLTLGASELAAYDAALADWRRRTDGAYDTLYTATNAEWMTLPAFVDQLQSVVRSAIRGGDFPPTPAGRLVKSAGPADVAASLVITER